MCGVAFVGLLFPTSPLIVLVTLNVGYTAGFGPAAVLLCHTLTTMIMLAQEVVHKPRIHALNVLPRRVAQVVAVLAVLHAASFGYGTWKVLETDLHTWYYFCRLSGAVCWCLLVMVYSLVHARVFRLVSTYIRTSDSTSGARFDNVIRHLRNQMILLLVFNVGLVVLIVRRIFAMFRCVAACHCLFFLCSLEKEHSARAIIALESDEWLQYMTLLLGFVALFGYPRFFFFWTTRRS